MLDQCLPMAYAHTMTRSKHALPPINAADFSIHAGPLVSHKAAMIVNAMMPPMMCIDHWHAVLTQDTGCVVFKGSFAFEPECLSEIASDVTRIAPPMAFCRGVSEHPASNDKAMSSTVFIDTPCVDGIVLARQLDGVTCVTVCNG